MSSTQARAETTLNHDEVELPFKQLASLKNHSEWRRFMSERIAMEMDCELFGVKCIYLIGSLVRGRAVFCSDIDLLIHVDDCKEKQNLLELWLDGWGKALAITNYLRTGYLADNLLDIHTVTDLDVQNNDSLAAKIKNPMEACCLLCRS